MGADDDKAAGVYFADPQVERLLDLILQLTVELNAANQRQRVLEMLLVSHGVLDAGAVDGFQPDETQRAELHRTRDELLGRWLRVITETGSAAAPLRPEWFAALSAPLP
ncbi:hypothetical protein Drose_25205 [Dactylosporangium roseum]|uniref:Uncharacterized protein n=1 Tax=Dactylosporangium roseum TaxID=47989 RepID=A0ABY5Z089_9ACTN|nr:hypothetical protein [Dactylosporangium roseum]UWZ34513.1 hypothetical protein Drose_25205 [Dactylosporangium roseum]